MAWYAALILGLIQGLTEFLPVSSSGHLLLAQHYLGVQLDGEQNLAFIVLLHIGTLAGVLVMYKKEILEIVTRKRALIPLFVVATIPAAVLGMLFKDSFESLQPDRLVLLTAGCFLITAALLWLGHRFNKGLKSLEQVSYADALIVGLMQSVALLPGVSRSGSTVAGGLWRNFDGRTAAAFSFILSIPVIGGAALLEAGDIAGLGDVVSPAALALGFFASMLSGMGAIMVVRKALNIGRIHYFSVYLVLMSALIFTMELAF